jgi:hypothetical protein
MKKELVLFGQEHLDAIKQVQSLDVTRQRLKYMTNKVGICGLGMSNRTFTYSRVWWKGNVCYYACDTYTLYLSASGKLFTRSKNFQGFTYEPDNKHNLKLWGKTKMNTIDDDVIKELLLGAGAEWALEGVDEFRYPMLRNIYMHKGLFQRILKGRITNAEDLVRAWLKIDTRWRELKISHRAKTVLTLIRRGVNVTELTDFLCIVSNVEATLDMLLQGKKMGNWNVKDADGKIVKEDDGSWKRESHFHWFAIDEDTQRDIRKELTILDKKINSTWSATRIMAEHTEMSMQVLDLEIEDMGFHEHGYQTPCPVLPGMELISDNVRLYTEGRTMGHCINSYLRSAQERQCFHFHCTFGNKPFSLSIEWAYWDKKWRVQQMFGKYNSSCSNEQYAIVELWLREDAVSSWLTHERDIVVKDNSIGL